MSLIGSIFKNQSPWGSSGPSGGSGNGSGSRREPPNIDELIRNIQSKINKFMPGGKSGGGKPIILGLLILFCIFLISSSIFGGSLLDPEPFPLPPLGPDEPHGD